MSNENDFVISEDGVLQNTDTENNVVIPQKICGIIVRFIGKNAFAEKNVTNVVIPDSATKISK